MGTCQRGQVVDPARLDDFEQIKEASAIDGIVAENLVKRPPSLKDRAIRVDEQMQWHQGIEEFGSQLGPIHPICPNSPGRDQAAADPEASASIQSTRNTSWSEPSPLWV